jgi:WD40 repeat protein
MHVSQRFLSCRSIGCLLFLSAILCLTGVTAGQEIETLPLILRYDAGGIDNIVKAIQWSPDGKTLYAAGWNKVVQVYRLDEATQQLQYVPQQNFRVPVDAGRAGIIEAMLLSPNGRTLLVAGSAWDGVASSPTGYLWPRSSTNETDWKQVGTISVFDTVTRACRVFRGHSGSVRQLAFVDNEKEPTHFASLGFEYSGQKISQSVRVWSLETGKQIGPPLALPHTLIPPSTDIAPRIQAWQSAPGAIHVALAAWRIERNAPVSDLMIWNPLDPVAPRKLAGAPVALALQRAGQGVSRRLFCGGLGAAASFSIGDGQPPALQRVSGLPGDSIPMAAALIPATTQATVERVAVVSVRPLSNGDKEYQLYLQESGSCRRVGTLWINHSATALPTATLIEPTVTVSPDGRFLSVAGSTNSGIRNYRISDLLRSNQPAGELKPLQILTGQLLRPDSAVFVRSEANIGIAVSTSNQPSLNSIAHGQPVPQTAVVVDARKRTALSGAMDWIVDRSDAGEWNVRISADQRQVEVAKGSSTGRMLRLPADYRAEGFLEEVTAHAVCVEHGKNPPLAAVATHAQGEPFLHVYDSMTGQCLRRLQGHERRITDLAFSADGKHLLSTSLDGTVRVWAMENLATDTIGQVGRLSGLYAATHETDVRIDKLETDSPAARAGIRQGDIVQGIVTNGNLDAVNTSGDLYLRISQTAPALHTTMNLRLQRADQMLDVAVPLEQGVDLRMPLFSMLLSDVDDAQDPATRQWLTWSPLGQFDVQGTALERQLGWHINTKDDRAPVRFSSIEQYRDRFLQHGLMQELLAGREVTVQKAVPPDLRLSLITASGEVLSPNYDDELITREPEGELILVLEDPTGELVQSAGWSIGEQSTYEFSRVDRDVWKSPISATLLGRDQHVVQVRYVTSDEPPVEFSRTVFLRYQPTAPMLKFDLPQPSVSTVRSEQLKLQASVEVAVKAEVTILHEFADNGRAEFTQEFTDSGTLTKDIQLKPGKNVIRIQARNSAIPASVTEYAALESTSIETMVEYAPVGPPQIAIAEVRTSDPANAEGQPYLELAQTVDGKLQVNRPQITIRGRIESDELLQDATWTIAGKQRGLAGFRAGAAKVLEFSETILLEPGDQILEFSASAGGVPGKLPIEVMFQPPLPDVELVRPDNRDVDLVVDESAETLPVEFQFSDARNFPFDYRIYVDDQPVESAAMAMNRETGLLSGTLTLTPDASQAADHSRIELRLTNQWGSSRELPLTVHFRHPPKLLNANVQRAEESALADIVCAAELSDSRPVSEIKLRVNGIEIPAVTFTESAKDGTHELTLAAVALTEGANRIEVVAVNRDGDSNTLVVNEVVPPAPKKAEIRLIRPLVSQSSSRPLQPVAFIVASEPGLNHVDLIVERDFRSPTRIHLMEENEKRQRDVDSAVIERQFEYPLALTAGVNKIRIEVGNRGGVTTQELAITYLPPPVSITLQRLVTADTVSEIRDSDGFQNDPAFKSSVPQGETTLEGTIEWIPGHRPSGKNWTVRVWVNGFLRTLKVPAPAEGVERAEFRVPLVLNLPENRLRVEAPEIAASNQKLAIEDYSIAALQHVYVDCAKPEQRQRLHLVLMGVQMENGRNVCRAEDLTEAAAAALRLRTPETAFASIKSYTTLVGEKAIGRNLRTMMVLIETQIAQQRLASGINDVVMFYYRGREYRAANGEFLLEDFQNYENPIEHPQSISESYLAGLFEHLPGAHVVFLDIENAENEISAATQWPRFPNLGLFRVAWSGKKPLPNPPGTLIAAIQQATDVSSLTASTAVSLGTIEQLLQRQLGAPATDRRFVLETLVPEDLLQLMIARIPSDPGRNQ